MREWFAGKSVCIVGGARALFEQSLGEEIDSYDVVCRLNGGAEIVKPESQGTRNDVWGIGKWWTVDHLFEKCSWGKAIHLSPKGEYMRYCSTCGGIYRKGMRKWFVETDEVHPVYDIVMPKTVYQQMGELYVKSTDEKKVKYSQVDPYIKAPRKVLKASTGLLMTYYASINRPKSITLYGFDWKRTPTWYFDEKEYNKTHQPHDWEWEEWFIKEVLNVRIK